ncbi:MAG: tRNA uridine-5-carboxymethylaminomethyl(34) synthesis GTPase MnmE [Alphaproteobacteria bacterium]|nr:tRNA uridine-5-carboxymethylaminomethyl(34) synthesis GTPase MnmE [Alphaproteobacteria bacterium]
MYALSSAPGRAGVAVVRVSGPLAGRILDGLTALPRPAPRRAQLRALKDPSGTVIDRALVVWFPGPASFTGEDVAELHVHGGHAVVALLFRALKSAGARMAEPGEFARRAFDAGKLDLTAVEGLADLIAAETETQRRQALSQMEGGLAKLYEGWRDAIVRVMALKEADIDFSDQDLPESLSARSREDIARLLSDVRRHLADANRGERIRAGIRVVILGPPNVGKSTLLNALVRREAAIVSETPGTTRDVIEVALDIGGFPVLLSDTAGLRSTADSIEREGIRRALERARAADLAILLLDPMTAAGADKIEGNPLSIQPIVIINKIDVSESWAAPSNIGGIQVCKISAKTGLGMEEFIARLKSEIETRFGESGGGDMTPAITRSRHRELLESCAEHLERALAAKADELTAEDLRLAARALGAITGRVDVESILDVIFRDFCIGK